MHSVRSFTIGLRYRNSEELSARAGRKFSIARLGHWVVKWFFFLGSLIAAAEP